MTFVEKASAIQTFGDIFNNFNGADPSKGLDSIISFLGILRFTLDVAGALAVIMILYGALLYTLAYGDDTKAETAKKTIIWSIVGLVILFFARTMVRLIQEQMLK